jgi:hypothetical protein
MTGKPSVAVPRRKIEMSRVLIATAALIALIIVAGCAGAASPQPSPGPTLSEIELKAALIDALGPPWYCDPDFYPVGRDEIVAMQERWAEVTADPAAFAFLAGRVGADPAAPLTDEQRLDIYRHWKALNALGLDRQGDVYRFDFVAQPVPAAGPEGRRVGGLIHTDGRIELEQEAPASEPNCPICLVRGTLIATPTGDIAVEAITVGTIVWTLDADGRRVAAPVIAIGSVDVGPGHHAIRIELSDGRSVTASAAHPLADGRPIGSLAAGDAVDGATVTAVTIVANTAGWTYDILPSGETGDYWANGVLMGSTFGN